MSGLFITAAGMVTPIGFNYRSSCAAIRAGVSGLKEANLWDGYSGEYLNAGKVNLPHWSVSLEKLADLAAPAIWECFQAAEPFSPRDIPLLLGVSSPKRPFRFADLDQRLLGEIATRLGHPLHRASRVIPLDRVSAVEWLPEVESLLAAGMAPYCVVAAVDSFLQQELVVELIRRNRILTALNSNGFQPGEAGSAILIGRHVPPDAPSLEILGWNITDESATIESEEPLRAEGLTRAIGGALGAARLDLVHIDFRISDLNGEHYRFKEMTIALMRYQRHKKTKPFELWHPIEYIGDPGAAIGPLAFGIALHAGTRGYSVGPNALLTFGNDDGRRAAAIVRCRLAREAA
jgi:3-oxoacyl-[acyl-carrier-protein] synthase I